MVEAGNVGHDGFDGGVAAGVGISERELMMKAIAPLPLCNNLISKACIAVQQEHLSQQALPILQSMASSVSIFIRTT